MRLTQMSRPTARIPTRWNITLRQIPSTDAERATAHEVIQEGRYNMGLILKDKLEDFGAAEAQWSRLLADYPDNIYRLDTYFNLYLMYMRRAIPRLPSATGSLSSRILPRANRPCTARPRLYRQSAADEQPQESIYANAYDSYLEGDTAAVRRAATSLAEQFPMSPVMPKMMFLDALTYVPSGDAGNFGSRLRTLLERYPESRCEPCSLGLSARSLQRPQAAERPDGRKGYGVGYASDQRYHYRL